MTTKQLHRLLEKYQLNAKKMFGQNFLVDESILEKIATSISDKSSEVIEIGPGLGSLTAILLKAYQKVICYEIDYNMIKVLENEYADDIKKQKLVVHQQDILKTKFTLNDEEKDLIANLPYYITTPILIKILEEAINVRQIVVMVQKEVALRLMGKPRTKEYNSLSVLVQYYTNIEKICDVAPTSFYPVPSVSSTVIKITRKPVISHPALNEGFFLKFNRAIFANRRKTLLNNLESGVGITKEKAAKILESLKMKLTVRAEELTVAEIVTLSDEIYKQITNL